MSALHFFASAINFGTKKRVADTTILVERNSLQPTNYTAALLNKGNEADLEDGITRGTDLTGLSREERRRLLCS